MVHLMNTLLNINDEREVNNNSKLDGVSNAKIMVTH